MADTLSTLSIISFVVAGVALAVAIVLWFFFDIPTVIGDLTGRTARKSIAKMRAENEKSGVKKHKERKINSERGKLTGTILGVKQAALSEQDRPETGLLMDNKAEITEREETGLLDSEATDLLDSELTGLLVDENETLLLKKEARKEKRVGGKILTMVEEVILIHTDEVIEW